MGFMAQAHTIATSGSILHTEEKAAGLRTIVSYACAKPGVSSFLAQSIVLVSQQKQY